MLKIKHQLYQTVGVCGTVACTVVFVREPSFLTPDKLVIFLTFAFMIFTQALQMLKRLLPFVALLLVYESFRGVADALNAYVNYSVAPQIDKFIFGSLPTAELQGWLWHGSVRWYDFVFYIPYLLHFVLPVGLVLLVWKTRAWQYWRVVTAYLTVSFAGFLTYLAFPAAPPWLASNNGYIQPITRISSEVWSALGIQDFPSLYNHIAPNPVAAVPSLHAAYATLLVLFVLKLYGKRWAYLAAVYPFLIFVGTVYQGEHYVFDVWLGIIYALGAYWAAPYVIKLAQASRRLITNHFVAKAAIDKKGLESAGSYQKRLT